MEYQSIAILVLLPLTVVILIVWRCWTFDAPQFGQPAPAKPAVEKCEIKVFSFADNHKITVHSCCDRAGLLSDAAAAKLHPESTLEAVQSFVHLVKQK